MKGLKAVCSKRTDLRTASTDSDLAVCVSLKNDLPGQSAVGNVCRITFGKSLFVCC